MEIEKLIKIDSKNIDDVFEKLDAEYGDITGEHIFDVKDDLEYLDEKKTFIVVGHEPKQGYYVDWGELEDLEYKDYKGIEKNLAK